MPGTVSPPAEPVSLTAPPRLGPIASVIGWIGARFIYFLIAVFGRTYRRTDVAWLEGPKGGQLIGDAPYREVAEAEGLTLERKASDGGLVPDFSALNAAGFEASQVHLTVRRFYEHTTAFAMDVWSQSFFPGRIGLWLLVTTISRQVDQLNFPLSPLDTASGLSSEIILLRRPDGRIKYTGWFRTLERDHRVLYTGFYMTEALGPDATPHVKVVFPMPDGNATVLLRPGVLPDGSFTLDSTGSRFGDAGFYRIAARGPDHVRVWHVKTLRERFRVYVDEQQTLRCDHTVRFLGFPVLHLHYKMTRKS